nr:MAG TPA: CRISPR-associated endonuclease [Caudoviricetes sp.]
MPWLKVSDTAAQHRIVWRALEIPGASMQSMWSLFGQVVALAVEAAAFKTDYIVERGSVLKFTGSPDAADKFIADATFCGYLVDEVPLEDGRIAYKLVEDEDLFHMRLREEIDWENRRRNDTRNGALIVPIRARDGDACRWCGHVVYWGDQRGGRGATYDHLRPGVPAETPDDMVVACRSCNSARKDNAGWAVELLPAPQPPYFGAKSAAWLTENGVPTKASAPSAKPVGRSVVTASPVSEFSRNQGTGSQVDEPSQVVQSQHTSSSLPTISAQQMIDEFSAQIDAAELALAERASAAEVVEEPTSATGASVAEGSHNDHFVVPKTTSQTPSQDWEELGADSNRKGDGFGYAGSGRDGKAVKNLTISEPKRSRHRRARTRRTSRR